MDVVTEEFTISSLLGKFNVGDKGDEKFFGKQAAGQDGLYFEIELDLAEPEGGERHLSICTPVTLGMRIIQAWLPLPQAPSSFGTQLGNPSKQCSQTTEFHPKSRSKKKDERHCFETIYPFFSGGGG